MERRPTGGINDYELNYDVHSVVCHGCKWLTYIGGHRCKAFKRIPVEIWNGEHAHIEPYPGDNGVRFEPIKK